MQVVSSNLSGKTIRTDKSTVNENYQPWKGFYISWSCHDWVISASHASHGPPTPTIVLSYSINSLGMRAVLSPNCQRHKNSLVFSSFMRKLSIIAINVSDHASDCFGRLYIFVILQIKLWICIYGVIDKFYQQNHLKH